MTYKRTLYGWIHRKEGLLKRITYVLQLVTMVTFHRTMGWDFFCFVSFFWTNIPTPFSGSGNRESDHFSDRAFSFFCFFFFLAGAHQRSENLKRCCYIFFPNQKAKCYHSNMTMLEMSICIADIKVEFFYFLPRVGALGEQPC